MSCWLCVVRVELVACHSSFLLCRGFFLHQQTHPVAAARRVSIAAPPLRPVMPNCVPIACISFTTVSRCGTPFVCMHASKRLLIGSTPWYFYLLRAGRHAISLHAREKSRVRRKLLFRRDLILISESSPLAVTSHTHTHTHTHTLEYIQTN